MAKSFVLLILVLLLAGCRLPKLPANSCLSNPVIHRTIDSLYNRVTGNTKWQYVSNGSFEDTSTLLFEIITKGKNDVRIGILVDSGCQIKRVSYDLGEIH